MATLLGIDRQYRLHEIADLRLVHLFSCDAWVQGVAPDTRHSWRGFTEWGEAGDSNISLGWEWAAVHLPDGPRIIRASDVQCNMVVQVPGASDGSRGIYAQSAINALVDGIDWQAPVAYSIFG